jgi:DNA-binding transcriptional ArsR family regulator
MYDGICSTSQARVLGFLSDHIGRSFYEQEIVSHTGLSRSAVNLATRSLYRKGLLLRERRGRMNFYSADDSHPYVRQFKVLGTIARLEPLLRELRSLARRVILFGSCAQGTNTAASDVDLFILASERRPLLDAIRSLQVDWPIQPVVANNQELAALKEGDPAFYKQIQRGIVLWEANHELGT